MDSSRRANARCLDTRELHLFRKKGSQGQLKIPTVPSVSTLNVPDIRANMNGRIRGSSRLLHALLLFNLVLEYFPNADEFPILNFLL